MTGFTFAEWARWERACSPFVWWVVSSYMQLLKWFHFYFLYTYEPSSIYCLYISNHYRFHSLISPGDTVSVIGEFTDQGICIIDHDKNLVIVHPELLISGTRVSISLPPSLYYNLCSQYPRSIWTSCYDILKYYFIRTVCKNTFILSCHHILIYSLF